MSQCFNSFVLKCKNTKNHHEVQLQILVASKEEGKTCQHQTLIKTMKIIYTHRCGEAEQFNHSGRQTAAFYRGRHRHTKHSGRQTTTSYKGRHVHTNHSGKQTLASYKGRHRHTRNPQLHLYTLIPRELEKVFM